MKSNLKNTWRYVAGGGTILAYQAFFDRMTNKNSNRELNDNIKSIDDKIDSIYTNISKSSQDKAEIQNIKEQVNEAKSSLNDLLNIHNKYYEKHANISDDDASKKLFESYKEEFSKAFDKAKNIVDKLDEKNKPFGGVNSPNESTDYSYIKSLINDFNEYLSNLSATEICLVINITSCILIIGCLTSIILAVYGNFFLNKLSLEKKYPRLATFIKLRAKLLHVNISIDALIILVASIMMIIINYITLTNF